MTKTIEVIVLPSGETKVQTKGFSGSDCRDASKFLEQALGAAQNETLTGEFFEQTTATQSVAAEGSP